MIFMNTAPCSSYRSHAPAWEYLSIHADSNEFFHHSCSQYNPRLWSMKTRDNNCWAIMFIPTTFFRLCSSQNDNPTNVLLISKKSNRTFSLRDKAHYATYSTLGAFDLNNPFFQNLVSNGRTCLTCHVPSE